MLSLASSALMIRLGGHHSISRRGGGAGQLNYFKFQILLHVYIEQFLK